MSLDSLETFPAGAERIGLVALSRRSLVYALGGLAYKGVALLTIPILARLLSPAELGLLDLAAILATLVALLAVLGTDQAVAFHESRTESQGTLWGSALAISLVGGAGLMVAGILFRAPLAAVLTGDAANAPVVAAAAAYGGVVALSAFALNAVRLHGTPRAYAVASFMLVTAEMAAALAIAWLGAGPVALIVLGWAAGATVVLFPILMRFVPTLRRPRLATVRRLLVYGSPLVPAAIAWLVGDSWIRATLARNVELAALGEYGIAYRVASVLGLVVTGFGVAWYPYLYRSPPSQVVPRASEALSILILALAGLGVALTVLSPEIIAVIAGSEYANAGEAVALLVGGMIALGAFMLIGAVVGTSGSTRRIAFAGVFGAAIQVVAAQPLIAALGLAGAALASLAGYAVAALILGATELRLLAGRGGLKTGSAALVALAGLVASAGLSGSPLVVRLLLLTAYAALLAVMASSIVGVSPVDWLRHQRTGGGPR